jgi:hypothetical protein
MLDADDIIDKFVVKLHTSGITIKAINSAPWVVDLAAQLSKALPVSFESLIKRYSFPVIEIGAIILFSNFGDSSYDDLSTAIFRDDTIYQKTTESGFIQFARPSDGWYDPICFDARITQKNHEYPIVRLDHEEILNSGRINIKEYISDSFYRYIEEYIKNPMKRFR